MIMLTMEKAMQLLAATTTEEHLFLEHPHR